MSPAGFNNDVDVQQHPRRPRAGLLPAGGFPQDFPRRRSSSPTTRTARASTTAPWTATSGPARTSGTSRWTASSRQGFTVSVAYVGAHGTRMLSNNLPAQRPRPEVPVARQPALRRVPARRHVAARRARALRRVGRADAELRAVGRPGAPALSPVLRQPPGREREPRQVHVPLVPGQGREALLAGHRTSSSPTRCRR